MVLTTGFQMDKKTTQWMAIASFSMCAFCLFVAVERYNANANNVQAWNAMGNSMNTGSLLGNSHLEPATPAVTKYTGFFAVLFAIGGAVLLAKGGQKES